MMFEYRALAHARVAEALEQRVAAAPKHEWLSLANAWQTVVAAGLVDERAEGEEHVEHRDRLAQAEEDVDLLPNRAKELAELLPSVREWCALFEIGLERAQQEVWTRSSGQASGRARTVSVVTRI